MLHRPKQVIFTFKLRLKRMKTQTLSLGGRSGKGSHMAKGQHRGKGETIVVVLQISYHGSYWDNKGDS